MGLFMDSEAIPLCFSVFPGNENEQLSMTPLGKNIILDFDLKNFVVCTDAELSSMANRKFNNVSSRSFITTKSIRKMKGFLQDFCLGKEGWKLHGSNKTYNLDELDESKDLDKTFLKTAGSVKTVSSST